ncbi:transketolase [Candidatus Woesearchaeota archaeon]|nr:transketolase [Candidatus Woesearchaeota archaeon]
MKKEFPINLNKYKHLRISTNSKSLTGRQLSDIRKNISIARDAIVFFTAYAGAKGLSGHTGGAYDLVPEAVILDALMNDKKNNIHPVLFDEAGHRVALQYLFAALKGYIRPEKLLHYREFEKELYGHPERDEKQGIFFSSGRLGHMWGYVNGMAQSNPDEKFILLGSDGSQQEGNDAEAARYSVANKINVKLLVDDNDVTIAGHPDEYMKGYSVEKTLGGHGIKTRRVDPEDIGKLYAAIVDALKTEGPYAIIGKRKMAPGIAAVEGTPSGHEVVSVDAAIEYLKNSANDTVQAIEMLRSPPKDNESYEYLGSSKERFSNRNGFGDIVNRIISKEKPKKNDLLVIDNDLEGSTGLKAIHKENPQFFQLGGIMERNNFSVAAGFGSTKGKQAIYSTFAAFTEMVISEITMARLNHANVIAHYSHSGIDDMADNTCHFGINNFFVDNGIAEDDNTMLYYPADINQLEAVMNKVFNHPGLRFVFTTRSKVPKILAEDGNEFFSKKNKYVFSPGSDEMIRKGKDGYIISYGEMLYRSLDAVERLKRQGIDIGLINKPTLNIVDIDMMKILSRKKFILLVESQNQKTGLGIRFGTWLLEAGFNGKYSHIGTTRLGRGGLWQQMYSQDLDPESIIEKVKSIIKR